jgi:aryl-alcohol dehydrogenase-like predicted oxidoreductase
MEYRQIGNTNLHVSVVGLGGNTFGPPRIDQEQTTKNINRALELGINFFDTAIIYTGGKSEWFVGNALKGKRDRAVIATKFAFSTRNEKTSVYDHIMACCDESLTKLQTDYIDLYQVHIPDPNVTEEEVMEPLARLVEQGKVRYLGSCNYSGWRHAQSNAVAKENGWPGMACAQSHYNVLRRHVEMELLPYCDRFNIGFLPYFPIAGGFLSGKYRPGEPAPTGSRGAVGSGIIAQNRNARNEEILLKLEAFAKERGHSVLDLAFAWLASNKVVSSIIAGTSSEAQVELNVAAVDWKLTEDEVNEINQLAAWDGTGVLVDGHTEGTGARAAVSPK